MTYAKATSWSVNVEISGQCQGIVAGVTPLVRLRSRWKPFASADMFNGVATQSNDFGRVEIANYMFES